MTHTLKVWPKEFKAVKTRRKEFEFRKDDRKPKFKVGDFLILQEWNPKTEFYSGDLCQRIVNYIVRGPKFGIPKGYCVMSIS